LIAHLGDSRAYLWNGKTLRKVTRDQTVAQEYIDSGVPAESVKQFRHVLTNCFGACEEDATIDFHHAQIQSRDVLLLCTDGLTELVSDDEIQTAIETMSNPQTTCDQLLQLALDRGGSDNITIILTRFESGIGGGSSQ
jgi:protein phosphatase